MKSTSPNHLIYLNTLFPNHLINITFGEMVYKVIGGIGDV